MEKSIEKIELSMQTGNADEVMKAVQASVDLYHPLELLTNLLDRGYIDAALYFYKHKTSHCSNYEMKYGNLYKDAGFTTKATNLLYNALINTERMEEAWNYHPLEYEGATYAGNASSYFSYISDVVNYYCMKNDKASAKQFVKDHIVWFVNNVDNGKWGEKYPDFKSKKVNQRLMQQINNY